MFGKSKFLSLMCTLTISVVIILAIVLAISFGGNAFGNPETLVFRSNSAKMVYDGSTLTDSGYTLLDGELKKGHTASVTVTGAQDGVGKSDNRIYVTILDRLGADVSADYNIITECGVLEIKPRPITIKTESGYKEYDGEPLTNGDWSLSTPDALMPGDYVEVSVTGTQTKIGSAFNASQVKIFDANGKDVTYNYDVQKDSGILTVGKKTLSVTSYSVTVPFGEIAQDSDYAVNEFALLPGHVVQEVSVIGRQELPGTSPNTIAHIIIIDEATGEDVSYYYEIIKNEGKLTVEDNPLAPDSQDIDPATVLGYISSTRRQTVYLKDQSYGAYMGNTYEGNYWSYAPTYEKTINGVSADYLLGAALQSSGAAQYSVNIEWTSSFFGLPYYLSASDGVDEYDQQRDTVYVSELKEYAVSAYVLSSDKMPSLNDAALIAFEKEYREFVYANYTAIDNQATLDYMKKIISENGFYGKDISTIMAVASFIQNSAEYNLEFDPALESEEDVAVAFLRDYKEGVCRHYATSAVALYRAMGIPARYTVGFAVPVNVGMSTSILAKMRHAWVEVYIDGLGWMVVEVTPGNGSGGGGGDGSGGGGGGGAGGGNMGNEGGNDKVPADKLIIELNIDSQYREYGTGIEEITYSGFEEYEKLGYKLNIEFEPIPEEFGKHKIEISSFDVTDGKGNTVTDKFFLLKTGDPIVQIYREKITVNNKQNGSVFEYIYDGTAHRYTPSQRAYGYSSSTIDAMGRTVDYNPKTSAARTSVGETDAAFDVVITDLDGNIVTDEYMITYECAKIRVKPREIEIVIEDAKKSYDGTPLVATEYGLNGELVSGEWIKEIGFEGEQTELGSSEAVLGNILIVDQSGKDVTKNYQISYIPGELKVTR